MFNPTEVIFAPTDACNLHCKHCFVGRSTRKLDISSAKKFLLSCIKTSGDTPKIEKVGFSGGEPFLYLDFLTELIKFSVENDLLFDQIMTNGDWWQTPQALEKTLLKLYNAGYDGKIGLSWDTFHGQDSQRMVTFVSAVQRVFGPDSLVIQSVSDKKGGESLPLAHTALLATPSNGEFPVTPPKIYNLPQTFPSDSKEAWKSWTWFKEDWCEGPGQILFIHPDGNIAPCCGFANEEPELFIGNINMTFTQVLKNAETNPMIKNCYITGLAKYRKELKKAGIKFPGKTKDICSFCQYICKNKLQNIPDKN